MQELIISHTDSPGNATGKLVIFGQSVRNKWFYFLHAFFKLHNFMGSTKGIIIWINLIEKWSTLCCILSMNRTKKQPITLNKVQNTGLSEMKKKGKIRI